MEIIRIKSGSLGDTIVGLAAISAYANGEPIAVISKRGSDLFGKSYPNFIFLPHDLQPDFNPFTELYYCNGQEYSKFVELEYKFDRPIIRGYCEQLGVMDNPKLKIDSEPSERPIKGKYICFSMHSTAQCKHWNHPNAWDTLCRSLKKMGITPICIDQYESFGAKGNFNPVPKSALKKIGMDLRKMINYINHAEFFIGLSSGISWVANALDKPVVMIAGMTLSEHEDGENILRINNPNVCHGCFNKPDQYPFDSSDWFWCPVYKGTKRQFECSSTISSHYVMNHIKQWVENNYQPIPLEPIPPKSLRENILDSVTFQMDWKNMRLHINGIKGDLKPFVVSFVDVKSQETVYTTNVDVGHWVGVDPRKTTWLVLVQYEDMLIKSFTK